MASKPVTIHGLDKWYNHCFEKLGWMILNKSNILKINSYAQSVRDLHASISLKHSTIQNLDVKEDLRIMKMNVSELLATIELIFPNTAYADHMMGGSKKKSY